MSIVKYCKQHFIKRITDRLLNKTSDNILFTWVLFYAGRYTGKLQTRRRSERRRTKNQSVAYSIDPELINITCTAATPETNSIFSCLPLDDTCVALKYSSAASFLIRSGARKGALIRIYTRRDDDERRTSKTYVVIIYD